MAAPGVVVKTATRSGPTGAPRAVSGQYFVIGITERGPIGAPVKINSLADYQRVFGGRTSYSTIYDDVALYFEAGGTQAIVQRAVGVASTVGTLSLSDGSSAATVRVDAASPGAWSTGLSVQVETGTVTGTRKVTVRLGGVVVEQYNNLATVADVVARFASSAYVKVTDLGSVTAAPGNLPAVLPVTALSAGADDRTNVNAARLTTLLDLFKVGLGDGAVAAPNFGQAMHTALIAHAAAYRRIAILGAARGTGRDDLIALGNGISTAVANGDAAGLFHPFVQVADGAGGSRFISPEGYVAASRSRAHEAVGPWQAGAGEYSVTPAVIGVDQEFSAADHDLLDAARISPIRLVQNRIRIYGWRSLSPNDVDFASLTVRDTLNRLVTEGEARLEPFVHKTVDGRGQVLAAAKGVLVGMLEPVRAAKGLFELTDPVSGEILDPGYSVTLDRTNNPTDVLVKNEVRAEIAVRLAPSASLITLTIVKVGLTAAV